MSAVSSSENKKPAVLAGSDGLPLISEVSGISRQTGNQLYAVPPTKTPGCGKFGADDASSVKDIDLDRSLLSDAFVESKAP